MLYLRVLFLVIGTYISTKSQPKSIISINMVYYTYLRVFRYHKELVTVLFFSYCLCVIFKNPIQRGIEYIYVNIKISDVLFLSFLIQILIFVNAMLVIRWTRSNSSGNYLLACNNNITLTTNRTPSCEMKDTYKI